MNLGVIMIVRYFRHQKLYVDVGKRAGNLPFCTSDKISQRNMAIE